MALELSHHDVTSSLKALDEDIAVHPDQIRPVGPELIGRVCDLVSGVEIDIDARLSAKDE